MKPWIMPALTILVPGGIALAGGYYLWKHRAKVGSSAASVAEAATGPAPGPNLAPVSLRQAGANAGNASVFGFLKTQGMPVPGQQPVAFNPDQLAGHTSTLDLPLI